jgi:hypothetical protein
MKPFYFLLLSPLFLSFPSSTLILSPPSSFYILPFLPYLNLLFSHFIFCYLNFFLSSDIFLFSSFHYIYFSFIFFFMINLWLQKYKEHHLLGCDDAYSGTALPMIWQNLLHPSVTPKMETTHSPKMSVSSYDIIWGHILEDGTLQSHLHENLKSHM